MKIGTPRLIRKDNQIRYQVHILSERRESTLWYSLHESFADMICDNADAALVAMLPPAMLAGEDIHVEGPISERLFYNLSGPFQRALQLILPCLQIVEVSADHIYSKHATPAKGVLTGFSCGIDSYCVMADHYYADPTEGFKVTHLLFNNVGSHGQGGERVFRERYERLSSHAEHLGLPLLIVNSNLSSFYTPVIGFQKTHTMRNTSVALLLQQGIGRYLYASTFDYASTAIRASYDISFSDTVLLPMMSTNRLDAVSTGSQHSRVQKTLRVAKLKDSYAALDVCTTTDSKSQYPNCGKCSKCFRTLATLEIAGLLDRYSGVFDLDNYRRYRRKGFMKSLTNKDPFSREIIAFAKENDFPIPLASRLTLRRLSVNYKQWRAYWKEKALSR